MKRPLDNPEKTNLELEIAHPHNFTLLPKSEFQEKHRKGKNIGEGNWAKVYQEAGSASHVIKDVQINGGGHTEIIVRTLLGEDVVVSEPVRHDSRVEYRVAKVPGRDYNETLHDLMSSEDYDGLFALLQSSTAEFLQKIVTCSKQGLLLRDIGFQQLRFLDRAQGHRPNNPPRFAANWTDYSAVVSARVDKEKIDSLVTKMGVLAPVEVSSSSTVSRQLAEIENRQNLLLIETAIGSGLGDNIEVDFARDGLLRFLNNESCKTALKEGLDLNDANLESMRFQLEQALPPGLWNSITGRLLGIGDTQLWPVVKTLIMQTYPIIKKNFGVLSVQQKPNETLDEINSSISRQLIAAYEMSNDNPISGIPRISDVRSRSQLRSMHLYLDSHDQISPTSIASVRDNILRLVKRTKTGHYLQLADDSKEIVKQVSMIPSARRTRYSDRYLHLVDLLDELSQQANSPVDSTNPEISINALEEKIEDILSRLIPDILTIEEAPKSQSSSD